MIRKKAAESSATAGENALNTADNGAAGPPEGHYHLPVLVSEVLENAPADPGLIVDCTVGGAGHSLAMLERFARAELFACDRDPEALLAAGKKLAGFQQRVVLENMPFSGLTTRLMPGTVDYLLADLGVSSRQLDEPGRGFSFMENGPLDMRMNQEGRGMTAAEILNTWDEDRLRKLFSTLGEERFSPRIAREIVQIRKNTPLTTTLELASLVKKVIPGKFHRKGRHPATKIFQALRMAVNRELEELESLLAAAPALLAPGGRIAVIAFHSLEDRLVKDCFRLWESPCECPP
ncbi:MAG: 16S rRNA (cytosine(1402)-N(4))-methyltransferase RsmH, partial [Deltaproteobacteria bacterium]|nr:16S rRNA (cytosine(1402)-N(4))-methyltransferase RsmH [Deltaproteobacteria bacterium]